MASAPLASTNVAARLAGHITELDGIRGLAVAGVIFFHAFGEGDIESGWTHWLIAGGRFGRIGVDLFFVLSGFLITGILLESKDKPHYLRNFYVRRVLRIMPLYYASLFVLFLVVPLVIHLQPGSPLDLLRHQQGWFWLHLQNFYFCFYNWPPCPLLNHYWSLAVEEQFYLFWPMIVWWLSRRALLWTCAAMIVGALLLRVGLYAYEVPSRYMFVLLPTRCDSLATGAVLAICLRHPAGQAWVAAWWRPIFAAGVVLVAYCFFATFNDYELSLGFPTPGAINVIGYLGNSLLAGGLLAAALFGGRLRTGAPTALARLTRTPVLTALGKYSYCLYIVHPLVAVAVTRFIAPSRVPWMPNKLGLYCLHLVVIFALSFVVAWLSWHLFEKRILKLKDRFTV